MNRNDLIDQCKRLITEAYLEATEMIVAWLETHSSESRAGICKDVDPENWRALEMRVTRRQQKRKSEGDSDITTSHGAGSATRLRDARSTMRNSDISADHKASIVAEADAATKRAIIERLAGDPDVQAYPDVVRQVERNLHSGPRITPPKPAPPTLSEGWQSWLNKQNSILMDGARLAERTEAEDTTNDVYVELGLMIYQRITERKIDAELRDLLDDPENVR